MRRRYISVGVDRFVRRIVGTRITMFDILAMSCC